MNVWIMGISGAGKTTLGRRLCDLLRDAGRPALFLDGDELRAVWGDDLGHDLSDRRKNHQRISKLCALLSQNGQSDVIVAAMSIFPDLRAWNRDNLSDYFEIFLDVPVEETRKRDRKGVYRVGDAKDAGVVVGVDVPFPRPDADLTIAMPEVLDPPERIAKHVFDFLQPAA